jgi:hypothetical protein
MSDFRTDTLTGEAWYVPSRLTTPEEDKHVNRVILTNTIKEVDEEDNPYLWIACYCMFKGHRDLHTLDRPMELPIGNRWRIWINGKQRVIEGIPPLGMEVYCGMERIGWLQLEDYDVHSTDLQQLKQAIIDDLLDDLNKID